MDKKVDYQVVDGVKYVKLGEKYPYVGRAERRQSERLNRRKSGKMIHKLKNWLDKRGRQLEG